MHSTLVRAQNVFGFFTTVAFFTALLTALSVLLTPQNPSASIELRNVQVVKGRQHYASPKKAEYAHIKFDLDAGECPRAWKQLLAMLIMTDFTSLFNWNTKQVFVWITATYPSSESFSNTPPSQAVIWDTIINSRSQLHPVNPFEVFFTPPQPKKRSKSKQSSSKKPQVEQEPGLIRLKNSKPKYQITDISGILSERTNVTLEVGWNVQPWVGALTWTMGEGRDFGLWKGVKGGISKTFDMPSLKGKSASSTTIVGSGGKPKPAEASPIV